MDIEKLNKVQIVLLTLLVSFVTSIATGIVTVSLMDQAPPAVAQTVNRVIEQTIETVASSTSKGQAAAAVVTQQKTVVVKESDLISQAVSAVEPSVVRLYTSDAEAPTFLGLGVIVDDSGTILTDSDALGQDADAVVELPDSSHVRAFVTSRDDISGVAYLAAATTTQEGKPATFAPISITTSDPVLGDTIVALAGKTSTRIGEGIITALDPASAKAPEIIESDIASDPLLPGSPLIDTNGNLLGISTGVSRATSASAFVSGSGLMKSAATPPSAGK